MKSLAPAVVGMMEHYTAEKNDLRSRFISGISRLHSRLLQLNPSNPFNTSWLSLLGFHSFTCFSLVDLDYTGGTLNSSFNIYLFDDQSDSFESDLTRLLHVRDCHFASSFFDQIHYDLRLEISRLPTSRQQWFSPCLSVIELMARRCDSGNHSTLEVALLCLTQLARFIKYVSRKTFQATQY